VCTSPVNSIEAALIELQYALGDYYCRTEQDHDVAFTTLDPSLRELRKIAFSVQRAISLVDAKPKIVVRRHEEMAFLHAVGR
jgi:hypothetical protein